MTWFCNADLEKLRAECRIPLRNETWNTWVLMRSTFDGPSDREVLTEAEEHVKTWLEAEDMHGDNFSVSSTDDLANVQFGGLSVVANRSSDCGVGMTLLGVSAVYVIVRFVLRGTKTDLAWPVFNPDWLRGSDCPDGASWILDRVFEPDDKSVPAEKPPETVLGKAGELLPTKADYGAILLVAGLIATAYIVSKLK